MSLLTSPSGLFPADQVGHCHTCILCAVRGALDVWHNIKLSLTPAQGRTKAGRLHRSRGMGPKLRLLDISQAVLEQNLVPRLGIRDLHMLSATCRPLHTWVQGLPADRHEVRCKVLRPH